MISGAKSALAWAFGGALVISAWWLLAPHQPTYQGKSLRRWLRDFDFGSQRGAEARAAIRQMGTNSLPHLIHLLTHHDNAIEKRFLVFVARHGIRNTLFEDDFYWHRRAALACAELGLAAEPALTALAAAATNSQAPDQVVEALSKMLPRSAQVLTNVVVTCGSQTARDQAMRSLVDACSYPEVAAMSVVALSNSLQTFETDYTAIGELARLRDGNYSPEIRDAASQALTMARPLPQYPRSVNEFLNGQTHKIQAGAGN